MTFAQTQIVPATDLSVISDEFDLSTITGTDVVFALSALVISIVLAQLTKRWLRRGLNRVEGLPTLAADMVARITGYIIVVLGVVIALEALGFSFGPVGGVILLLLVLVVIAARPLLQDLGAGLIIQIRRPFHAGDQILLDGSQGQIEEVTARSLRLLSPDGRRIHVPNRRALDQAIVNFTAEGARMSEVVVGVAYSTDLDHACAAAVDAMGDAPLLADMPAPTAQVDEFAESTINIVCRFWHEPRIQDGWAARDQAIRQIKRCFDADNITIAFPQRVLWDAGHAA